jgi:hypothetical protein
MDPLNAEQGAGANAGERGHVPVAIERPWRAPRHRSAFTLACYATAMKDRTLIYLSLLLSLAAIGYAAWIHHRANQMAVDALRRREVEFVTHYTPKMTQVYSDMGGHTNVFATPPQTIEELFRPMVDMMNRLGGSEDQAASSDGSTK